MKSLIQKLAGILDFICPSGLKGKEKPVLYRSLNPCQRELGIHSSLILASNPIGTVYFCIIGDKFYLYI